MALAPSSLSSRTGLLVASVAEWKTMTLEGVSLTPAGRALVQQLATESEARLQIDELRSGLRVQARSWVGVVRLDDIEIRVVPKLAGDQVGLVRMLDKIGGLEGLTRLIGEAGIDVSGTNLFDLVALLFADACERVVRQGLLAGYIEKEEDLPIVRGRILADRQVRERFGRLDRIICRFDDFEHDIDENRLLALTLMRVHRRVCSPTVRGRVARLRAIFEPICELKDVDLKLLRRTLQYNRLNAHYRPAHDLAWLILDGLGVDELLGGGDTACFAFLLDMNALFERFVDRFVRLALVGADCSIQSQARNSSIVWDAVRQRPYRRVIPDLLVEERDGNGGRVAADAKYKLYDQRRIDPSDIYQSFLYAYALSRSAGEGVPGCLLMYPSESSASGATRLHVRRQGTDAGAQVTALGVPIPRALEELERGQPGPIGATVRMEIERALSRRVEDRSTLVTR